MNIKTIVLTCLMLAFSLNTFAEWRKLDDICKDLLNDSTGMSEIIKKVNANGEFGYLSEFKTPGIHLHASDTRENHNISLRYNAGIVDYFIRINDVLSDRSINLYLDLLDSDHYLIKSIFITKCNAGFTGKVVDKFQLQKEEFYKIKYYNFSITTNT